MGGGIKLKWQEAVIAYLIEDRPPNHTSVLALVPVLAKYANRDGKKIFPRQETMGEATGLHRSTVMEALRYLTDAGLLIQVRNRPRGVKEYKLNIADEPTSDLSDDSTSESQIAGQVAVQVADEPTHTTVTTVTTSARGHDLDYSEAEFEAWVQAETAKKDGGPGLAATIRREDRQRFEFELADERSRAERRAATEACDRCDSDGWVWTDDSTRAKCKHRMLEAAS